MPPSPARPSRSSAPSGAAGSLVWFRRDLRDVDHAALARALSAGGPVYCAFVFDREILDALRSPDDRRVEFIHASVVELDARLRARGGGLHRATRACPRRDPVARARARRRHGVRQPRLRAGRARARRRGRGSAGANGIAFAREGPGDLRARRGGLEGRHAVLGVHALQAGVAREARARAASRRIRPTCGDGALARAPRRRSTPAFRRSTRWASGRPTSRRWA